MSRSRSPRVLQVVLRLDPGGTERLVVGLVRRLHPHIPTMVCCLEEGGQWARDVEAHGVAVRALHREPGFRPGLGQRIATVAREHGATVMHAHHYSPFIYAALARVRPGAPRLIYTEHGRLSDAPPSLKRQIANSAFARIPDRTYCVSEDLKRHVVAEGFGAASVGVIYNGIDVGALPDATLRTRMRAELGVAPETFVIGTVARLDPVKDLGSLIRAVAAMPDDVPVILAIVGDGPERQHLEQVTGEVNATSRVRFLGHRDNARDWLAACDAYVNCSISEGVSLTILEAMAAGLPVIVTAVGGTPEVVDSASGVLVPARDSAALADALARLVRDPQRRQQLGTAARRRVEEHFTLDRMVREYAEVYEELS
jgi:glycosyltransferase involved in cell wall biosynthesis